MKTAHSNEIRGSPRAVQELHLLQQLSFCAAETIKAPCGAFNYLKESLLAVLFSVT